jgi:superoxide reductase
MVKMADVKFWKCEHCGNVFYTVVDGHVPPFCCGEKMVLLESGASDGAAEKHVPAVTVEGDKVIAHIGDVDHPMLDEHWIEFVALVSEDGKTVQIKYLNPGDAPEVVFNACCINAGTIYEYCNLHGLWKKDFTK